jgi:hypothetical protein
MPYTDVKVSSEKCDEGYEPVFSLEWRGLEEACLEDGQIKPISDLLSPL